MKLADVMVLAGCSAVTAGVAWYAPQAGLITAGVLLLLVGLARAARGRKPAPRPAPSADGG